MDESALIRRFFDGLGKARTDVVLGIGDDAAVLAVPEGHELVVTTDVLAAGVHFPNSTRPEDVGHKSLAVNLSDLAAMGAEPAWATLNLSLPQVEPRWLEGFSSGFSGIANEFGVQLVGGDTIRAPLSIGVQLCGFVPKGQTIRRSGAKPGDGIYVTGTLGDAALGLLAAQGKLQPTDGQTPYLRQRFERPMPRVQVGCALRGLASAAIDISDGLAADLERVLSLSDVGAEIDLGALPLSPAYTARLQHGIDRELAATHGDDYELCLTVPPDHEIRARKIVDGLSVGYTRIGVIESEPGLRVRDHHGELCRFASRGFDHFRSQRQG